MKGRVGMAWSIPVPQGWRAPRGGGEERTATDRIGLPDDLCSSGAGSLATVKVRPDPPHMVLIIFSLHFSFCLKMDVKCFYTLSKKNFSL